MHFTQFGLKHIIMFDNTLDQEMLTSPYNVTINPWAWTGKKVFLPTRPSLTTYLTMSK